MLGFIGWLIIGALAGWLASSFMGRGGYGLVGDIIVGIIGAFVGGWLASVLFGIDITGGTSWLITLPIAVIGAIIVIWVTRMLTRGRSAL